MASVKGAAPLERAIEPQSILVLARVGRPGGVLVPVDPVLARVVNGTFTAPKAGETVPGPNGAARTWEEIKPDKDGVFQHESLSGGYAYLDVPSDAPRIAILEAAGHSSVFVNGEPRTGDVYRDGYVHLPVLLRRGANDFLFRAGRGALSVRLVPPAAPVAIDTGDPTLPDLHAGQPARAWGAVVVVNATEQAAHGMRLLAGLPGGRAVVTPLPDIPALSVRKVGFRIGGKALAATDKLPLKLTLLGAGSRPLHTASLELRVRKPGDTYKETFISRIDGSVQYFAVNPAQPDVPGAPAKPALFLSLHGASVQAIGQADAYGKKSWGTLVAPTNRRPYGYDWEDWGRIDAMEVLDIAQRTMNVDPLRTYLVGHSMGGHGTWQIGAIYPDRFAAIGPSAGWISSFTYSGAKKSDSAAGVEEMVQRAGAAGDTLLWAHNYAQEGVYILHGDADDNVPVTEARHMKEVLSAFHHDFVYHEEPGQGHWWDLSDEPGADCVDWAPMFDFLGRHALPLPESVRQVDFTTVNPGISARCHWAVIEAQQTEMQPSTVHLLCDPQKRRFTGTTENVARLTLDLGTLLPGNGLSLDLDKQKLEVASPGASVTLVRTGDKWAVSAPAGPGVKNPRRYGPFRQAFDHKMQFVYGTGGTKEEAAWAFARARFDAETWWYRGNGAVDVIPDTAFRAAAEPDRSIVLYGNADTNRAWSALLPHAPVQVRKDGVRVGGREIPGENLACLFLQPRPGSDVACVAAVSGTGLSGLRLTDTLPYLQPMVGFPDLLVVSTDALEKGSAGIRAAGFFGPDWGVTDGEIAWGEAQ